MIIPSNEKGTGFLRTCYSYDILYGVLEKDEFLKIIDMSSKVVAKVYSKKRLAENAGIDRFKIILSFIAMALATIFLCTIYLGILIDNTLLEVSSYGTIIFSFFFIIGISVLECRRDSSKKFINFNHSVK